MHRGASLLGVSAESDRNVGADAKAQIVGLARAEVSEHSRGRRAEIDDNLRRRDRQTLSAAQIERHPAPAPGIDLEAQRRKSLHLRVLGDTFLLAVASELATHESLRRQRTNGLQHLDLLVAQRLAI